jgi:hypothetical protein
MMNHLLETCERSRRNLGGFRTPIQIVAPLPLSGWAFGEFSNFHVIPSRAVRKG